MKFFAVIVLGLVVSSGAAVAESKNPDLMAAAERLRTAAFGPQSTGKPLMVIPPGSDPCPRGGKPTQTKYVAGAVVTHCK